MRVWNGGGKCTRLRIFISPGWLNIQGTLFVSPCSWEYTHQLFKGFERSTDREFDIRLRHVFEVGRKGREVVWVVPLPRRCLQSVVLAQEARLDLTNRTYTLVVIV